MTSSPSKLIKGWFEKLISTTDALGTISVALRGLSNHTLFEFTSKSSSGCVLPWKLSNQMKVSYGLAKKSCESFMAYTLSSRMACL